MENLQEGDHVKQELTNLSHYAYWNLTKIDFDEFMLYQNNLHNKENDCDKQCCYLPNSDVQYTTMLFIKIPP
jgi:hypothetical protein